MQTTLSFAGLLAIVVMTTYLLTLRVARQSPMRRFLFLGGTIALIRIGTMSYLQFKAWNHAESLADLPLLFLVLPEAFVTQYVNHTMGRDATVLDAALLGLLLAIGSFALARLIMTIERCVSTSL